MSTTEIAYLSVKALTKYIKRKFDADPHLRQVYVRGELSNVKIHTSGHIYFTLKDDSSKIAGVMFATNARSVAFKPENGMTVLIRGEVNVFEIAGNYQLYANDMQPDGVGALFVAFEQLKEKLRHEGLFRIETKKKLPAFPKTIGLVTATTGAAIRDVLTTLNRRFPLAKVIVFPTLVQGRGSAPSIVQSIQRANQYNEIDVLIVGRGGGSIEDLWAFNDEIVARAIYESEIPIISAVGHETDTTIADYVADVRAATPTAAAELSVPNQLEISRHIIQLEQSIQTKTLHLVQLAKEKVDRLQGATVMTQPERLYRPFIERHAYLQQKLESSITRQIERKKEQFLFLKSRLDQQQPLKTVAEANTRVDQLTHRLNEVKMFKLREEQQRFVSTLRTLEVLNPLQVMGRGFGIVYKKGHVVEQITSIKEGDVLSVTLKDGTISAKVLEVSKGKEE
ncbi:exodeoxyribonuclease VII large subunit [Paenisporosarcina cavernae]|uniref:Exodeoxyribonuclease 7 large subunit n=1 Tax=Paenisporosarcina cavernae TaxID=2320858 RepID=A0A385YWE7_9BACL|nr:exodeoxyribonuclease VII large subunit [Paenisporosarcina cavernae]AYC30791.1 exodeoxyribonuclease VII large subunit [Paenisporosarcina cavernae]